MTVQGQKKSSITLRVDSKNLSAIQKEADRRGISLNTLANQIFDRHVDWYSNYAEANLVSFPQELIKKLFDKFTEAELKTLGKEIAKKEVKDIVLLMRKSHDPETFLDIVDTWVKVSNFPHDHDMEDSVHKFVIQHDMGKKTSIYLSAMLENVFEEMGLKKAEFDITANTVAFSVDTKKPL